MSSFIPGLLLATTAACGVLCVERSGAGELAEPSANAASGEPAFESIGVRQGMASSVIYSVFVDRYGFVWLAGDSGVHRYDGQSVRTIDRDPDQRDTLASRTNA